MSVKQKYAQVIVDIPALELNMRTFSYSIPDSLRDKISIGSPISIPFGRQDPVFGYVVGFTDYIQDGIKVKPIFDILDDQPLFDLKYLEFIEWVSNYYMCPLVSAISAAIPSGLWSTTKRMVCFSDDFNEGQMQSLSVEEQAICQILLDSRKKELTPTTIAHKTKMPRAKLYNLIRALKTKNILKLQNVIDGAKAKPKLVEYVQLINKEVESNRHIQILEILEKQPEMMCETKDLVSLAKTTRLTIKKLEQLGHLKIFDQEIYRNPLERFANMAADHRFELTDDQKTALEGLKKSLNDPVENEPMLLYGVAGSGKTEVYFQLMDQVIRSGKSVIFLVPEITLTSQISARIISRFGPDSVGIWHSSLSTGERLDIWKKIHSGEIRIVLGARSAVFAPVKDLGLIVMDEEHESAYKQDTPSPRYHARDIALERAKRFGAKVILGSATPDVITFYRAKNLNKVYSLPSRVEERPMAKVYTVDMREELERGNKSIFSRSLSYSIQETIDNHHQVMLLINRRGFTTYVFCRSCGYVAQCKNCSIPMIFHASTNELRCHYCNHRQQTYTICPECSSTYIKHYGTGTQKVEQEIQRKFPQARVLRLDSDVTSRKNAHYEIIEAFSRGEADILIGTQMIAKGLDLHGVTLVGVLASDSVFTFPDYRSMERGFQLLTQVAGRAGRGKDPGKVIFQCYSSHLYPLMCAQKQDYSCFYSFEIVEREKYNYPPFSQLIRIILSSEYYNPTFSEAIKLAKYLDDSLAELSDKIEILGPSECIIPKIQGKYRMQILIKNIISTHGHKLVTSLLKNYNPKNIRVILDVDPLNML